MDNNSSKLRGAIALKKFLITAEVTPPKGGNPERMLEVAKLLKNRVHGVNITDGSRAVLRMSSVTASALLLREGIEPICQVTGRDRNSIGLQGDLMGAYALGIRNILALTGDPIKAGDHLQARSVFELESIKLLKLINHQLNEGFDINNKPLPDGKLDLFAGAAVDPQSKSWSGLQRRFERKLEAGAQFFQSQLITDFDKLDKFMNQIAVKGDRPILAGIFLLKSAKNAHFINKYVPGVEIPDHIIKRLENAKNPLQEGIKIASEQVKIAQTICQGVHLMAVKKEELIPEILNLAGIKPLQ
ncbi:methylenetetrahydrofolate reductase [Cyanobacterium stanieri LEGE 03274]|uniref:Methylenetetrahydrofolate reductase n=1 Tax=Cyanobacterium stanieri LEGE 03274 TaxID=1828756 RepID=A0ABR9V1J0_9CHRO|nr:methylenetetrahydrofolate reductase [Cyanobacterium stanieri]MBE9221747.1 methylenetetrahydrofolate reductase [Cyanobacterium stanieri LEGE 03274]